VRDRPKSWDNESENTFFEATRSIVLRRIPLATLGLVVGIILTSIGIIAYVTDNATLNLAGFFYGIPLVLGGMALKSAELKPIPFSEPTADNILALREQQATITQNKLRRDVTRYCYGQSVHLDSALKTLGLAPNNEEIPVLQSLKETEVDGAYALVLEFASPKIPLEKWEQRREQMEKFFGPGVRVIASQPETDRIDLTLVTIQAAAVS
jgi:hypothetical protein